MAPGFRCGSTLVISHCQDQILLYQLTHVLPLIFLASGTAAYYAKEFGYATVKHSSSTISDQRTGVTLVIAFKVGILTLFILMYFSIHIDTISM